MESNGRPSPKDQKPKKGYDPEFLDDVCFCHLLSINRRILRWLEGDCESAVVLSVLMGRESDEIQLAEMEGRMDELRADLSKRNLWSTITTRDLFHNLGIDDKRLEGALTRLASKRLIKVKWLENNPGLVSVKLLVKQISRSVQEVYETIRLEEAEEEGGDE